MILGNIAIVLDSEVELKIFTPKFIKYKMKNQDENGLKQRYEKYLENGNVSRRIAFVQDEVNTQIE